MKAEVCRDLFSPLLVKFGMVVAGIIDNDNDLAPGSLAHFLEFSKKVPASLCVKVSIGLGHDQPSVSKSHRSEVADAFSGWRMLDDGVFALWRNPHRTT